MYKSFLVLTVFSFLINVPNNSFAQSNVDLVNAINNQLIPLKTLSPDDDFSDLEKLKVILKEKSVIGIGEATHGTKEFFQFKHRMLKFLVKEMGFKNFVIEADFAGTMAMNDYVINGKGDVNKGLWGMGVSIWMTQEVVDMADWLKEYNSSQSPENKVRFWGCDMQWGSDAMEFLKEYMSKTNQLSPEMNTGFEALKKYRLWLTPKEKKAIRTTVTSLDHIQFTGIDSAQIAMYKHHVRELQQFVEYMDLESTFFPAKQQDVRDKYMAENIEWIYNYTGRQKMMIWAHNAHINKSSGNHRRKLMGMFLSEVFKDKYYAMGFDFNSGQMRSFDTELKKNMPVDLPMAKAEASGALFAQCTAPNFILDFKTALTNPSINFYLNSQVPSSHFGAGYIKGQIPQYVIHKLVETFDALIFIRDTNAAKDIKKKEDIVQ